MFRLKEQITFLINKHGGEDEDGDNKDTLTAKFSVCGHKQSFPSDRRRRVFTLSEDTFVPMCCSILSHLIWFKRPSMQRCLP
jgi:hypothetical protein